MSNVNNASQLDIIAIQHIPKITETILSDGGCQPKMILIGNYKSDIDGFPEDLKGKEFSQSLDVPEEAFKSDNHKEHFATVMVPALAQEIKKILNIHTIVLAMECWIRSGSTKTEEEKQKLDSMIEDGSWADLPKTEAVMFTIEHNHFQQIHTYEMIRDTDNKLTSLKFLNKLEKDLSTEKLGRFENFISKFK